MRIFIFMLLIFGASFSDIVNDSETQLYFTAGIPGKDSSATSSQGTQFYYTAGVFGGDSISLVSGCDSLISFIDTSKVWTDAIAAQCSVVCDTNAVVFQYATDTSGSITSNTAKKLNASGIITDTTSELEPSTEYFIRFVSSVDTGGTPDTDTTLWNAFTTLDSTDTSDYWLYSIPEISAEIAIDATVPEIAIEATFTPAEITASIDINATLPEISLECEFVPENVTAEIAIEATLPEISIVSVFTDSSTTVESSDPIFKKIINAIKVRVGVGIGFYIKQGAPQYEKWD